MKSSLQIYILYLFSILDLCWEYGYQLVYYFNIDRVFSRYSTLSKAIIPEHVLHDVEHSIIHNIIHLSIHLLLVISCIFFFSLLISQRLRQVVFDWTSYVLGAFPAFKSVSNFEICLLTSLCSIIRYFENKWVWDMFVPKESKLTYLWPFFVVCLWAPIEIRFKIYLEKTIHYKAPYVLGLMHAVATVVFPLFYFTYSKIFFKVTPFELNVVPDFLDMKNIQGFHKHSSADHLNIMSFSFFNKGFFLVEGKETDLHHHLSDISLSFLLESYKFMTSSRIYFLLYPFITNLIFAYAVVKVDKMYLKQLTSPEIHHICAHLILEEFLNIGFNKFFSAVFSVFAVILTTSRDTQIQEILNSDTKMKNSLIKFISFLVHSHRNICPSSFYSFFHNETNTLDRIDFLLNK